MAEAKPDPKAEVKAPALENIKTVYGRMVDPTTMQVYNLVPTKLLAPSGWVDSQLAAGKMQMVS